MDLEYWVMNVERLPHRLAGFRERNSSWTSKISLNIFKCYDGDQLDLQKVMQTGLFDETILYPQIINKYIVGNILSQRDLWLKAVSTNLPIVVMEDDVTLNKNFPELIDKWIKSINYDFDICLAGVNFDSNIEIDYMTGVQTFRGEFTRKQLDKETVSRYAENDITEVAMLPLVGGFGVPCYVISPKGAKYLLDACFPFTEKLYFFTTLNRQVLTYTLDIAMNIHYRNLKSYLCFPPLAVTENDKSSSGCTSHEGNNVNISMF